MSHGNLREQAALKEKEWRELQQLQNDALETSLKECQRELKEEKSKFHELKEHFKYNLRLIKDRDSELERYDALFLELKTVSQQKETEISDLKVNIDELKISLDKESKAREEMQLHYQQRLREKQVEIEQYRCSKDAEINKERDGLELVKHSLDRRVIELEQELETQRRELTTEFEEAMRRKEHEYRLTCDKMNATVLSHDLKVKMLMKEMEMLKASQDSRSQEMEQVESVQKDLEKLLRQKEWELEDVKAMSGARIAELEAKLHQTEQSCKRQLDEYQRKFAELDRATKEKEATVSKVREMAQDRERLLHSEIQNLTAKLEESAVKMRQLEWNVQDMEKEKGNAVERLESELADVKLLWETNMSELSRENVARDLELNALRDNDAKLRSELQQRKHDVERYKRDLALSIEREAAAEQSKAQLELDWQRRCEDLERLQYASSEDLVRSLSKARDEALAELRVRDASLHERDDLIKLLRTERDQALATLSKHGLMADRNTEVETPSTDKLTQLQKQNEELKQVVRQMRNDMELLGEQLKPAEKQSADEGLIHDLKADLDETKSRCKQLEQTLSDYERGLIAVPIAAADSRSRTNLVSEEPERDHGRVKSAVTLEPERDIGRDSALIGSHMQQLNNVIGSLRGEKMELTAQLRKNQLRIVHLENMVDQLSKQPREKQVEIDQLQYELGATKRRTETELTSLRQRISDLELQVTEARKEADEYYRASVERNTEATALANQLSQLKLEMARSNPTINFGAQELLIQQLQDEISRLRQQLQTRHGSVFSAHLAGAGANMTVEEAHLEQQLQKAMKLIAKHLKEKEVLIEVNNRLRAELLRNGLNPPSPPTRRRPPPADPVPAAAESVPQRTLLQQNVQNKLKELEKLQYDLTKQELAQRRKTNRTPSPAAAAVKSSDSDYDQPRSILKQTAVAPSGVTKSPRRAGNTASSPKTKATATNEPAPLSTSLSSYGGGESLQEVWAMMESDGPSSRGITPRHTTAAATAGTDTQRSGRSVEHDSHGRPQSADSWTVQGSKTYIQSKNGARKSQASPRTANRGGTTSAATRKTKIRNYNVKEDSHSIR